MWCARAATWGSPLDFGLLEFAPADHLVPLQEPRDVLEATKKLDLGSHLELAKDRLEVIANRIEADEERLRNVLGGPAHEKLSQDLALSLREAGGRQQFRRRSRPLRRRHASDQHDEDAVLTLRP